MAVPIALAGCGGGGGSQPAETVISRGTGVGLPLLSDPQDFRNDEYRASGVLPLVDAASLYAIGGTGEGRTIALIDTGIDQDHSELHAAISAQSRDIEGRTIADGADHGTLVAGLLAAARDGSGMHGLAYDAEILAIRADRPGSCPAACSFPEPTLALATDHAVEADADVINFSLGAGASLAPDFEASLKRAVAPGKILVFAAGNGGASQPSFPARFAASPDALGRSIIVGAVDRDLQIAGYSNRAGAARQSFLVAPGDDVLTTFVDGGYAIVSGTSFASPTVAGAAAALWDAAPYLTAEEVVEILLTTARDLGEPGVDGVYGHGLLDLAAASEPQGELTIPDGADVAGEGVAVGESSLILGGSLAGAAPAELKATAFDSYGRPFTVDLSNRTGESRSGFNILERLIGPSPEPFELDAGTTKFLASHQQPRANGSVMAERALALDVARDGPQAAMELVLDLNRQIQWQSEAAIGLSNAQTPWSFWRTGAGWRSSGQTRLSLSIGQHLGSLRPEQTSGRGAFKIAKGASASFAQMRWETSLFGVDITAESLVARQSYAKTSNALRLEPHFAWGWHVAAERTLFAGRPDSLRLSLAQPMRAIRPGIRSRLPIARDNQGQITKAVRHNRLRQSGREIDMEIRYQKPFGENRGLSLSGIIRNDPDHSDRQTEWIAALTYNLKF